MPNYVDYRREEIPTPVSTKTGPTGGYYETEKVHTRTHKYSTEKKRRSKRRRTEGGRRRKRRTEKRTEKRRR